MRVARWQHTDSEAYGPAVSDSEPATATLARAEVALRNGEAKRAKATYLRALGKLGPFSDPAWRAGGAEDHRTRSQCHARLAAIAFDEGDYHRSLRQTAAAAAARRDAISAEQCTGDDVRFMITALVHAATVHERLGERDEAIESCHVALEFSRYAEHTDHDPKTRRSIASAERAANRLLAALRGQSSGAGPTGGAEGDRVADEPGSADLIDQIDVVGTTDETPELDHEALDLVDLADGDSQDATTVAPPPLDLVEVGPQPEPATAPSPPLDLVAVSDQAAAPADFIDLTSPDHAPPIRFIDLTDPVDEDPDAAAEPMVIDLTERAERDPEVIDLTDQAVDNRFDRRTDWLRAKAAERRARQAQQAEQRRADRYDRPGERRQSERTHESPAILMARARAQAMLARFLLNQSPDEAVINAHRAVRTATRARQWAKHDHNATPQVALALIDTLVTRSDVLGAAGNAEVGRGDLRRSRAIGEQLWQVCPSVTTAAAAVLVAARSASFEWRQGNASGGQAYFDQAQTVVTDAEHLGLVMPPELTAFLAPLDRDDGPEHVTRLGDRVLDELQAGGFDTREVPHEAFAR